MEHITPTLEIFNELRDVAINIWKENYSDEFGYVSEKVERINSLDNYEDNIMVCYRMFDGNNQQKMIYALSNKAINYINDNK